MRSAAANFSTRSRGFSLVELMVAMVLGLILLAGLISTFVADRQAYQTNENMARLQETARIVNELMGREIRAAGGNPCGTPMVANVITNASSNWWSNWTNGTLIGFDESQAVSFKPFGNNQADRVQGTDALLILSATLQRGVAISVHNHTSAEFQLDTADHDLDDGDIAMVCDPYTAAIFQVTKVHSGTTPKVEHKTGNSASMPGNCSIGLGYPTACTTSGALKDFTGGTLVRLHASFWYVGKNGNGGTSLYRLVLRSNSSSIPPSATVITEEIVENISDMQIQYLAKNGNSLASNYVDASSVSDWSLIVAVRPTLSLQTKDNVGTTGSRITRTLSFTTSIRNREEVQ